MSIKFSYLSEIKLILSEVFSLPIKVNQRVLTLHAKFYSIVSNNESGSLFLYVFIVFYGEFEFGSQIAHAYSSLDLINEI